MNIILKRFTTYQLTYQCVCVCAVIKILSDLQEEDLGATSRVFHKLRFIDLITGGMLNLLNTGCFHDFKSPLGTPLAHVSQVVFSYSHNIFVRTVIVYYQRFFIVKVRMRYFIKIYILTTILHSFYKLKVSVALIGSFVMNASIH